MVSFEVNEMTKQQPVAKVRAGRTSCAVFENNIEVNGQTRTILKATVARRYMDKDGSWKSSNSFSRNEIPVAIYCLIRAFDAMVDRERLEAGNGGDRSEEVAA
jgi:hypothetical protein